MCMCSVLVENLRRNLQNLFWTKEKGSGGGQNCRVSGSADEGWATVFKKVLEFLKDCDKIKLEGVVTTVDQETFDWISCVFWWRQGQIGPALLTLQLKKLQWPEQWSLTDRKKWTSGKLLEKQLFWNYTDWEQYEVAEGFPLRTNMGSTWFIRGKRSGAGSVLQVLPC